MRTSADQIEPFPTRDGSEIRELMHPARHPVHHQSLAEATVAPGQTTALHRHRLSEELYHIVAGRGRMILGDTSLEVRPGDTVCIAPGTPHCITNTGDDSLRFLCCCAPPYSHDDTELL